MPEPAVHLSVCKSVNQRGGKAQCGERGAGGCEEGTSSPHRIQTLPTHGAFELQSGAP